ncbi:MAG: DUF1015 domain-containing protein [Deltaproteobacteria bacterium]|nr:DUF1015 domain-containing protein [Deltaproteobacteria bacterium]
MSPASAVALATPELLLPHKGVDLGKWAVVACDQYTSEPEYWAAVEAAVADAPSTLRLIYPEVFLGEADPDARIARIREAMSRYLAQGVFEAHRGFVLVQRDTSTGVRRGLVVGLDLEHYSFEKGASTLIRATEGTILERLPPRIRIREGAPLELPHIMVLIDDPGDEVIGPLVSSETSFTSLYDFDLMSRGGRVRGHLVPEDRSASLAGALSRLAEVSTRSGARAPFLYAMGDGNHSLATAKTIWERIRAVAGPDDPRRFALVELVNVHDPALVFEPIHRVLFGAPEGVEAALVQDLGARVVSVASMAEMKRAVEESTATRQRVGLLSGKDRSVLEIESPSSNLAVGTVQPVLDRWVREKRVEGIDYVHGSASVESLGSRPGHAGIFLPSMDKRELFETVVLDGALPRKTFSMGEADDKRFYLEARRL